MHLAPLIVDLATILGVAGLMAFIFQKIRQPVVLGYILAGVIVGPYTPPFQLIVDVPSIQTWAELGVIFLMFTLGLEFSFRKLMSVGLTGGLAAGFESIFFLTAGYGLGRWFGWTSMDSLFLGAMFSISSTTIVIKALEELKLKSHRFSTLIFGVLIVEDLFAILLIVALTTIASTDSFSILGLASAALNLLLVVGGWFITGYFIVPRLMAYVSRNGNNEMITLVSIGLCLTLVVIASHFGYSAALGAFIMGSILAETKIINRIEGLMAPLKDLFGAIFFVSIGMLIDPKVIWQYKEIIALLCVFTIIGKIVSISLGAIISGQSLKNSLKIGFGLAQIGEFSFIIASLGMALEATSPKLYPIAVAVSLVTTFTTPYFMKYSGLMADKIESLLPLKVINTLNRYSAWCEHKKMGNTANKDLLGLFAKWVANGIVVTLIFNLSLKFIGPSISSHFEQVSIWPKFITWSLAFIMSSPFIWGMVFTSRKNYIGIRKEMNISKIVIVLLFPILTSIWIGILSTKYFSLKYIFPITGVFLIIIYFTMYKRLESYYKWFERTFLETFEKPKKSESTANYAKLAPWDSHLVSIVVHPNANLVSRTLMDSKLRSRFGINVVAIQRGMQSLIAPHPNEAIFPGDTLVVLGTDEQLAKVRPELEVPENIATMFESNANYRLKHIKLSTNSGFIHQTIREAGFREKYHVMIVGIERDSFRILNPHTDFKLQASDILWVVGEANMINDLIESLN